MAEEAGQRVSNPGEYHLAATNAGGVDS